MKHQKNGLNLQKMKIMSSKTSSTTSSNYLTILEIAINQEGRKSQLLHDFFANYPMFEASLYELHQSFIHVQILSLLTTTKNWNEAELNTLFPVSKVTKHELQKLTRLHFPSLNYVEVESYHEDFLNSQVYVENDAFKIRKGKGLSRNNGAFYTSKEIVSTMCERTFAQLPITKRKSTFKALDFAAGTGNFYFQTLMETARFLGISQLESALKHVHGFDKDATALSICKLKACYLLPISQVIDLKELAKNLRQADFIEFGITNFNTQLRMLGPSVHANSVLSDKYDVILSNPPYLNLKYNKPKVSTLPDSAHNYLSASTKNLVQKIRQSGAFRFSSSGMLNLYRLSIDMMLSMVNTDGIITVICPSSIFADKTALLLRKELLYNCDLSEITYFREDAKLFEGVTQSTVIFTAQKSPPTSSLKITNSGHSFAISKSLIPKCFPETNEIPLIDEVGWKIIMKLNKQQKLADLPFFRNKRGELDLSLHKEFITSKNTSYQLIRGNRLKAAGIDRQHEEFVKIESFKKIKSEDYINHDFENLRLVCNQISNVDSKQRLRFLQCQPKDIIANSCNYLSVTDTSVPLDFYLTQLNSPILNWFFRTISGNNHINNYQIDALPILNHLKIDPEFLMKIREGDLRFLYSAFSLTAEEASYIENF